MGARTGRQYLDALDSTPRELWYGDEKITHDISKHPAFSGIARSMAALYEMQHRPELVDTMTYESPTTGQRVGMSFLQPKTADELAKRRKMTEAWADYSGGMLEEPPTISTVP